MDLWALRLQRLDPFLQAIVEIDDGLLDGPMEMLQRPLFRRTARYLELVADAEIKRFLS